MAANFGDLAEQRFDEDLNLAAGYKPLTMQDLKDVYKRYEAVGVKVGRVKGKSDQQLYKQATNDVIRWWKHNKSEEAKAKAAAKKAAELAKRQAEAARRLAAEQAAAARRAQQQAQQRERQQAAQRQQQQKTAAVKAAEQREARDEAARKRTVASSAAAGAAVGAVAANAWRSTKVPNSTVKQALIRYGLLGKTVPSWATKDLKTFNAWLTKARAAKARADARGKLRRQRASAPAPRRTTVQQPRAPAGVYLR